METITVTSKSSFIQKIKSFVKGTKTEPTVTNGVEFTPENISEGNALLKDLTARLMKEKSRFETHSYSGHPEEQLELIEWLQYQVAEVRAAKARGWSVDPAKVAETREQYVSWAPNDARRLRLLKRFELAEKGII